MTARYFVGGELRTMAFPDGRFPPTVIYQPVPRPMSPRLNDPVPTRQCTALCRVFRLGHSPLADEGIYDYYANGLEYR